MTLIWGQYCDSALFTNDNQHLRIINDLWCVTFIKKNSASDPNSVCLRERFFACIHFYFIVADSRPVFLTFHHWTPFENPLRCPLFIYGLMRYNSWYLFAAMTYINHESSSNAVGVVLYILHIYQSTYRHMYLCVLGLKGWESCQMGLLCQWTTRGGAQGKPSCSLLQRR